MGKIENLLSLKNTPAFVSYNYFNFFYFLMEPLITMGTGENLGAFSVNTNQVMGETGNVFLKFLQTGDNLKNLLIILAVVIVFGLVKLWIRKRDDARRHEDRENKERERARIWEEETKG